MDSGDLHVGQI